MELGRRLRGLPEDPGSVLSNHMEAPSSVTPVPRDLVPSTDIHAGETPVYIKNKYSLKKKRIGLYKS